MPLEKLKTKTLRQKVNVKAAPREVYESLMDSKLHSKLTGAKASISRKEGGRFTAYDGGIYGKNLKLVQDKLVAQEWYCQTPDWPQGHFSKLSITLSKTAAGTRISLVQELVPQAAFKDISQGWRDYYWVPMKKMLEGENPSLRGKDAP